MREQFWANILTFFHIKKSLYFDLNIEMLNIFMEEYVHIEIAHYLIVNNVQYFILKKKKKSRKNHVLNFQYYEKNIFTLKILNILME